MFKLVKKDAKLMLRQHLGKIIILLYVQACAWLAFGFIFGAGTELFDISPPFPGIFTDTNFFGTLFLLALIVAAALMVLPPLWLGLRRWLIYAASDPNLPLWEGFYYFGTLRRYVTAVWYGLRSVLVHIGLALAFFTPGCMLVFGCYRMYIRLNSDGLLFLAALGFMAGFCLLLVGLVGLIWFLQRYFLTAAYLCSGCSVHRAVKNSVRAMSSDKGACARLLVSYIPMFLSCVLIVPALYVIPHFLCAVSIFSKVLMLQNSQNITD